jgi:hypothetical protein
MSLAPLEPDKFKVQYLNFMQQDPRRFTSRVPRPLHDVTKWFNFNGFFTFYTTFVSKFVIYTEAIYFTKQKIYTVTLQN